MIIDTLDNLGNYVTLNPLFGEVVAFLKSHDLSSLEAGKYPIKGDELFVNIQVAKGKTAEEAVVETHRKMVDIQVPISGSETYGFTPAALLPEAEYDESKDMTLLPGAQKQSFVTCEKGMFAIFFPQDGHAPCITSATELKKAIFKVKA